MFLRQCEDLRVRIVKVSRDIACDLYMLFLICPYGYDFPCECEDVCRLQDRIREQAEVGA